MSGNKNKEYTHISIFEKEIMELREQGKTSREIAEIFGFRDKYVVKQFMNRWRKRQKEISYGIVPKKKGRPSKGYKPSETEKDNEIRRLQMENDLLRSFLHAVGRR